MNFVRINESMLNGREKNKIQIDEFIKELSTHYIHVCSLTDRNGSDFEHTEMNKKDYGTQKGQIAVQIEENIHKKKSYDIINIYDWLSEQTWVRGMHV